MATLRLGLGEVRVIGVGDEGGGVVDGEVGGEVGGEVVGGD